MDPKDEIRIKKKKRRIRKKWNLRFIHVFEILVGAFFVLGLIIPLRPEASDIEKRKLAEFPTMTAGSIWDGSYFEGISTWYSDSYPFRENFLGMGAAIEKLYGIHTQEIHGDATKSADEIPDAAVTPAPIRTLTPKPEPTESVTPKPDTGTPEAGEQTQESSAQEAQSSESAEPTPAPTEETAPPAEEPLPDGTIHDAPEVAGTVYVVDNRGFAIYYFNHGGADAYASMMNTVRATLDPSVTVYDMLAPSNFSVCLDESIQESLDGSSARDAFNYIDSMLDPSIVQVSVIDTLINHNAEYIYYNTDHHWTALGAYYAYLEFCAAKGITPHDLSYFTEAAFPGFLGTFYSYSNQSDALASNPDTVYAYIPVGTNDETVTDSDGTVYELNVVNDMTNSSAGSKYSAFLGGDTAMIEVHNPAITDGSSILLVKESYGNAFAPFLVDHYQNVYIVDYRYYTGNLTNFINEHGIQDVLFLNNADALSELNSDDMLAMFY